MATLLSTKDLTKSFGGVQATNAVSIELKDKGLRSIIGPNGAGKTTLINLITGRFPASSGQVLFGDRDVTNRPAHELARLGICRTFQITSVFQDLSVFENVRISKQARLGGSFRFFSTKRGLRQVEEETWGILERVKLADLASQTSSSLAYGDQRVLEVAIALASSPSILFLDEPTAGMSPAETRSIAAMMRSLAEDVSIVLVEHDMDLVMSISDRISVLHFGSLVAEGTPEEIHSNELVREAYLGKEASVWPW
jgi:branched-chain amino acid transport system ATP-binding protein